MPKPRESDTKGKPSNRRRRRFGGGSRKRQEKPPRGYQGGGNDPGLLAESMRAGLGAITWLWHATTSVLSWRSGRIEGEGGWSVTKDGLGNSHAGVVLVFGAATTAGAVLMLRYG